MCIACETVALVDTDSKYKELKINTNLHIYVNSRTNDDYLIIIYIDNDYEEILQTLLNMDFKFVEFISSNVAGTRILMQPPQEAIETYASKYKQ